jgi:hypothetical protein
MVRADMVVAVDATVTLADGAAAAVLAAVVPSPPHPARVPTAVDATVTRAVATRARAARTAVTGSR